VLLYRAGHGQLKQTERVFPAHTLAGSIFPDHFKAPDLFVANLFQGQYRLLKTLLGPAVDVDWSEQHHRPSGAHLRKRNDLVYPNEDCPRLSLRFRLPALGCRLSGGTASPMLRNCLPNPKEGLGESCNIVVDDLSSTHPSLSQLRAAQSIPGLLAAQAVLSVTRALPANLRWLS
jgi:hypothetical protein